DGCVYDGGPPADGAELHQFAPEGPEQPDRVLPQPTHAAAPWCAGALAMNSCASAPVNRVRSAAGMNTDSPAASGSSPAVSSPAVHTAMAGSGSCISCHSPELGNSMRRRSNSSAGV